MPSILTRPSGGGAGGGASVAVVLDDITPKLGQSVTITATATGITPTSYTFYLPQQDGSFETVTQVGNTYAWAVSKYDAFTVTVTATDGSSEGSGSATGTTTGDVDADAFITAHNTATGGTMDSTMEANTLGFFLRLKGINTTYNENVFSQLLSANAELYPMMPDDVSNASISGYSINAIDPTRNATMVGFVAGDATTDGLTGGAGKYMIMNNAPDDFGQNDASVHAYIRTYSQNKTSIGASDGTNTGSPNASTTSIDQAANAVKSCVNSDTSILVSAANLKTGFFTADRNNANYQLSVRNEQINAVEANTSAIPSANVYYGMAGNQNGTAGRNYDGSVSCLINSQHLQEIALITLTEAVSWLQTQIGRNV